MRITFDTGKDQMNSDKHGVSLSLASIGLQSWQSPTNAAITAKSGKLDTLL